MLGLMIDRLRAPMLVLGLLFLGACASGPAPISPDAPQAKETTSRVPTPALPADPRVSPAVSPVDSLLEESRSYRREGNLSASFARLERALRIAPQRAEVYLELARTHQAAGRPQRASASAERGLLYCVSSTCTALRKFVEP